MRHHRDRSPRRHGRRRPTSSPTRRWARSSTCCARSVSWISRRRRCSTSSSTRAPTWPACRPTTGCCGRAARPASDGARRAIRPGCGPSSWPASRWSCGRVVVGYHQAQGPPARRVLRPLRGARHLQPLRRGLVRGPVGVRRAGQGARRRRRRPPPGPARPADPTRRPRQLDDLEPRRRAAGLPGHRPHPQPPPREQRQPLLGGPVQDPQVLPAFPERFGSIEGARAFCRTFFTYYNHEHRHSGIAYHTPASVPYGTAPDVRAKRAQTLDAAYAANPVRFRHRRPEAPKLPTVA